jgi:phage terminase small subunit
MPRKSSAALRVPAVDGQPPLEPPTSLSRAELELFCAIINAVDKKHFRPSDLPLLTRYVEACVLAEQAAKQLRKGAVINGRASPWLVVQEKAVRAMTALSMRLRLSPQGRQSARGAGREKVPIGPPPWGTFDEDGETTQ